MKSKYCWPVIQPALCLLASSSLLAGCLNVDDKLNIIHEEEPEPGDVVVPADPNEIPEQGTTKPEGSGGLIPGTQEENSSSGGGQTGNGSINSDELSFEFVTPSSGNIDGGYEVRIRGTLLNESGTVKFGAVESPKQTYVNKQVVRAVVPAGKPGCVDVTWTQDEKTLTVKDGFAYGLIITQGFGKLGSYDCSTACMLRVGGVSQDEFFVSEKTATEGLTITNKSDSEPLVMLKHYPAYSDPAAIVMGK